MIETPRVVNPLREGMRIARAPDPSSLVLFGATGDLAHRKLLPALYNLMRDNYLPPNFTVVGFGRRPKNDREMREEYRQSVSQFSRSGQVQAGLWDSFSQGIFYVQSKIDDLEGYRKLKQELDRLDQERGLMGNRLYYLAVPPEVNPTIIKNLGEAGLNQGAGWTRVIVEKPFGRDLSSARALNRALHDVFDESQVYRIDHYLGKETVQNIFVFRFANGILEPIWNRNFIDHVQITVAETVGVEGRGEYYESAGALRDIIQNHALQLLALTAMEPPPDYSPNAVRDEKAQVLRSIHPVLFEEVASCTVRGQYGPGGIAGQTVPGYRQELEVAPDSTVETYVALKLTLDNWRWAGVPFYLRTGKRLAKRISEIAIQFNRPPLSLFRSNGINDIEPNVLVLNIQPDEGISLKIESKIPGQDNRIRPVNMDFRYGTSFGVPTPEAYERLLLDAMLGDPMLFTREDEVEAQWALITPILAAWERMPEPAFPNYEAGTWGPDEADYFVEREGRKWRRL
jgi:glucose-6-phosphate 1-dehydrogenase